MRRHLLLLLQLLLLALLVLAFAGRRSRDAGQQFDLEIPDEVAQGVYSNFALVSHTDAEFTLDFAYLQPQAPRAKVRARVITSPKHVKRLIQALQDNVAKYEAMHGTIEASSQLPPGEFRH